MYGQSNNLQILLTVVGLVGLPLISSSSCPPPCKCSTSFKTVDCTGRGLTTIPSPFPEAARIIKLSSNRISSIEANVFNGVPHLEELYLSGNRIGSIDSDVFNGCTNLTMLQLSGNALKSLQLKNLSMLETLDVSQNQLTVIPTLDSISQLKYLYLGNNLLQSLTFPQQFSTALSLQRITLSNNNKQLKSISTESFKSLSNSVKLSRLYLSRCGISNVAPGSFSAVASNLASLSLSQNPINMETVQTVLTDFQNKKNLMSLDLSGNSMTGRITNHTFSVLGDENRLASLDLSTSIYLNGIDVNAFSPLLYLNTLKLIQAGVTQLPYFKNHTRLTKLVLSRNSITYIEDRLPPKLAELSLDSNSITAIDRSPFSKMADMTMLRLDNNKISTFTGHDLIGIPLLRTLNMSHNELNYLPNDVFVVLGNLTVLDLSSNNIVYINNSVFSTMVHMATIDISNNRLQSFTNTLFHNMVNLTSLKLSHNKLGIGFSDSRLDFTGVFAHLTKLQVVDLSFNEMTSLPAAMVAGAAQLQTLNLADNSISSWNTDSTLKGLPGVKSLLLNNNKLAVLSSNSFSSIHNLSRLDLSSNPFACTCEMREFRDWLNNSKMEVVGYHSYTCATPPVLKGTKVIDYDLSEIQCLSLWIWILTGVLTGVVLLLIIICILYRFRYKIGYRLHKCLSTRRCCACCRGEDERLLASDNENIQFAAFLSHCEKEECKKLVRESILPSIDNNNSTYPGHRGSYPIVHRGLATVFGSSMSYYAGLEQSLETSGAYIILVCKHYRKNRKLMNECDLIQHSSTEHRKSIILVLTNNAYPLKDTPTLLLPIIDAGNHIEWVRNEEGPVHRLNGRLAEVWNPTNNLSDCNEPAVGGAVSSDPLVPYYSTSEVSPLSIQALVDSQ